MNSLIKRGLDAIVHPTIRLPITTDFPLTGKTLGIAYVVGFILFIIGSLLPALLFAAVVFSLIKFGDQETLDTVLRLMYSTDGKPQPYLLATLMASSFICGFACQMTYLSRLLRKRGHTLMGVVGLSTASLRGSTRIGTAWAVIWRALTAFGIVFALENVLGLFLHAPEQPTIEYARMLSGGSMLVFFLIAAVGAPLFEEFVFRGVLFQALRSTFHGYRLAASGQSTKKSTRFGRFLGRRLFQTSVRSEVWSVVLSGAVFALWHLQFHPVQLLMLFLMGCALAEVFRRSGTLWTAICLHAVNNGLVVLLLWMS